MNDLFQGLALLARKDRPIALCRACDEPLVSTLMFPRAEFYCVGCGRTCGFLDPKVGDETPELLARMEANKVTFDELSRGLVGVHVYLNTCSTCDPGANEYHRQHWTEDEAAADAEARRRLRGRTGVAP